jgi:hypothetical protein
MVLIGLAILGFGITLITNPLGLLKQAFIIIVVLGGFFLLYKLFIAKRMFGGGGGRDLNLYRRAAKQSARRYKHQVHQVKKKKPDPLIKKPKRKDHNFTVIEGKKGKKNNRAL